MKAIFALCGAVLVVVVVALLGYGSAADHHGQPFANRPTVRIASLVDRPQEHLKEDIRIEGQVVKQCPSTGCWYFLADAAGKEIKVEMSDITPRLPPRLGWTATVEGQLIPFGTGYEFIGVAAEFKRGDRP